MSHSRGFIDSGLVSGNETQFVFSERDMRHSDAENVRRAAVGECITPSSIKFLWITRCMNRPFHTCISTAKVFSTRQFLK